MLPTCTLIAYVDSSLYFSSKLYVSLQLCFETDGCLLSLCQCLCFSCTISHLSQVDLSCTLFTCNPIMYYWYAIPGTLLCLPLRGCNCLGYLCYHFLSHDFVCAKICTILSIWIEEEGERRCGIGESHRQGEKDKFSKKYRIAL